MSNIPEEKLNAFKQTEYRVPLECGNIVLRIDVPCPELASFRFTTDAEGAAFITAFNPASTERSEAENLRDHSALKQDILGLGLSPIEGEGAHPHGSWAPETSWFVPGISFSDASDLGRRYGQDAIVWCGADAVPRLILLR